LLAGQVAGDELAVERDNRRVPAHLEQRHEPDG
jgi:hypothetical protein